MSLVSRLDTSDSALRRWFEERLPCLPEITGEVAERTRGVPTIRPAVRVPWSTVGGAAEYRMLFALRAARPYFSQWGACGIEGAMLVDRGRGLVEHLPAEQGALLLVASGRIGRTSVREFFLGLRRVLEHVGESSERPDAQTEVQLCRYCYALMLFDEIYRAGPETRSPLHDLGPGAEPAAVLALASQASVDDIREMTDALYRHQPWLLEAPAELKPTFAGSGDVGGADADLIADGCLIDVKAAVNPAKIGMRWWPWQLLGYALLDYEDSYRIDSLGLYLPRQAMLIRWPLEEYASRLAGEPVSIAELRGELRGVLAADPATRVQRLAQAALEAVARRPGIVLEDIARELATEPNSLLRLLSRMAERGLLIHRDERWYPAPRP